MLLQLLAGGREAAYQGYQGTSLWRPFFFLLVDSFLSSSLSELFVGEAAAGCPFAPAAGAVP